MGKMAQPERSPGNQKIFAVRHPALCYFALAYAISWLGALAVAAPKLARGEPLTVIQGLMMFPVMLLGPSISGIIMTRVVDGKGAVSRLFSRMRLSRVRLRWCAALLIPPGLVLATLLAMKSLVSPVFTPNEYFVGMSYGVLAGVLEEIGWSGFALPKMTRLGNALAPTIVIGLLWSAWHLPVINFLGTAIPHGTYWFRYFLAFAAAMTAMRVLISWVYVNTGSLLLAQAMHAVSTGSLVAFSPARVSSPQEAVWYFVYAGLLWITVATVALGYGKSLLTSGAGAR